MGNIAAHLVDMFPRARHARIIRSWAGIIENTPDGRPVIDRLTDPSNVVVATLSSIGFGLSPASGHAVQELVTDGVCRFADLSSLKLARFAGLATDWVAERGWHPTPVMTNG
jgi:sarcosine oxidase subunit beta